jgi:hypothetical protein
MITHLSRRPELGCTSRSKTSVTASILKSRALASSQDRILLLELELDSSRNRGDPRVNSARSTGHRHQAELLPHTHTGKMTRNKSIPDQKHPLAKRPETHMGTVRPKASIDSELVSIHLTGVCTPTTGIGWHPALNSDHTPRDSRAP